MKSEEHVMLEITRKFFICCYLALLTYTVGTSKDSDVYS